VNPADSPIFMLALTSAVLTKGQMYDAASTIMAQKLSQVTGVGQVFVGGSALPGRARRAESDALNKYGIGLEQVRAVLKRRQRQHAQGHFSDGHRMWEVGANDQIFKAIDYRAADRRLPQRRRGAHLRCRRGGGFGGRPAQRRLRQRQALPCW
jgi:multidrug efflux pump